MSSLLDYFKDFEDGRATEIKLNYIKEINRVNFDADGNLVVALYFIAKTLLQDGFSTDTLYTLIDAADDEKSTGIDKSLFN